MSRRNGPPGLAPFKVKYEPLANHDGYIDLQYSDRTWPVLILGFLLFLPGAYHVRLAWFAWCGRPGYSYADIPDFDD
uniref:Transmembrane protein 230 n=1 Tax=Eptatretus burgeri TaxID=7764 RepID=A0A8C4Q6K4_EPTBU